MRCISYPVGAAFLTLLACGCAIRSSSTSTDSAEKAVEQVLDSWARGESADKFADSHRNLQVTDPDWKSGVRLVSFLTVATKPIGDKPDHFLCRVALTLKDLKGVRVEREVTYNVQMGETIIIGRASK